MSLKLIATKVSPHGERFGKLHAVVTAVHHLALGLNEREASVAQLQGSHGEQHFAQGVLRAAHAHVLGHGEHGSAERELALVGLEDAGEDAQNS